MPIFAVPAKAKWRGRKDKTKFFKKSSEKIWKIKRKGIIFAPLSPHERGDCYEKEIIESDIKRDNVQNGVYVMKQGYIQK